MDDESKNDVKVKWFNTLICYTTDRRIWHCFKYRKLRSCLQNKAKEHRNGMLSLYKDMEACGGYQDIQVMWEMIHSSSSNAKNIKRNNKTRGYWRFYFATT